MSIGSAGAALWAQSRPQRLLWLIRIKRAWRWVTADYHQAVLAFPIFAVTFQVHRFGFWLGSDWAEDDQRALARAFHVVAIFLLTVWLFQRIGVFKLQMQRNPSRQAEPRPKHVPLIIGWLLTFVFAGMMTFYRHRLGFGVAEISQKLVVMAALLFWLYEARRSEVFIPLVPVIITHVVMTLELNRVCSLTDDSDLPYRQFAETCAMLTGDAAFLPSIIVMAAIAWATICATLWFVRRFVLRMPNVEDLGWPNR